METTQSVPVWRPPADRPTALDPAVALRMTLLDKRFPAMAKMIGVYALLALAVIVILGGLTWLSGVFLVSCVLMLASLVQFHIRIGGWLPAAHALLAGGAPQRVKAQVVTWRRAKTVVAVGPEPFHLEIRLTNWGVRRVIARAGEVWLSGPDANGQAVVFVDAIPVPLPAKVVAKPTATKQEPPVTTSAMPAEDQLPVWLAGRQKYVLRTMFAILLAGFAASLFFFVTALSEAEDSSEVVIAAALTAMVVLLVLALARGIKDVGRLTTRLKAGPWTPFPVLVQSWKGNPRTFGDAQLQLWLPDGTQLSVTLVRATVDLISNVSASGTLWVAGTPRRGEVSAVGVPGYPCLGLARC